MTPFMHRVQALLEGESAPVTGTVDSAPTTVPVATDTQVIVRSLAEQLVSEANAVLREHGEVISLVDDIGPGELAFTLTFGERSARLQTVMSGRSALVNLIVAGHFEQRPCRLSGEDELQGLVLNLIA